MKNLFFNSNLKTNTSKLVWANGKLILNYSTAVNNQPLNMNSVVQTKNLVPKLDANRNSRRFGNSVKAIMLYLETQSGLEASQIMALNTLISRLEVFYSRSQADFVTLCKTLSNWYKVNAFKITRTQDKLDKYQWNARAQVPMILMDIFLELNKCSSNAYQTRMIHRMVLSIFDLYTVISVPKAPSFNSIVDPFTGKEDAIEKAEIVEAISKLELNPEEITQNLILKNRGVDFHLSSASGPNGQSTWLAHIDAKAINKDLELKENLKKMTELLGRDDLWTLFEESLKLPNMFSMNKQDPIHSKLHFIYEKGDKVRTIAILDYWTQEVLCPFHDLVADILKEWKEDGTFDQNAIAERLRVMTAGKKLELFSLDLTAATDRLPITLQRQILDVLIQIDGFGYAWQKLLTFRNFTADGYGTFRYAVGQPMGAKSSFTMLALTHHIIVQIAAKRAGILERFTNYIILGDDIVIGDAKVASEYKILMKDLGLELQPTKSIESVAKVTFASVAEICKRVFVNGMEITPIPMKLLANVMEQGHMCFQLQDKMSERGLINHKGNWRHFVVGIIKSRKDLELIAKYNGAPSWLSGLKDPIAITDNPKFDVKNWSLIGLSMETLFAFYVYTVVVEQMKRLSTLIQNSDDIFNAITRSGKLSDASLIEAADGSLITLKDLDKEKLKEFGYLDLAHPVRMIMLGEVNRISMYMQRLSSARGTNLMESLLGNVIDSLKYSVLEIVRDKEVTASVMQRTLYDKWFANLELARTNPDKTLKYSVKLSPLGIVWHLKVTIDGSCTISRSTSNISTTLQDAQRKLAAFNKIDDDLHSLFKNKNQ